MGAAARVGTRGYARGPRHRSRGRAGVASAGSRRTRAYVYTHADH
ncbi:MAG: hypothetical protein AVDCRST_MAG40-2704 [uncultured Gemmatimonadaceae bacterium]|uniref:Uncharacterized protein n=1 Tax=uncultured Gemmatimonadaceae bacterium TaxID=246130 RepID=A0A6J4M3V2_9BACT|nr:MAG: hypothetical protein AVDCRST_MAG40-2704 [uncultured Gemmatimonadaceae bacterium]